MIKLSKLLMLILAIPLSALCQIPNASFENWTDSVPDDWNINILPPSLLPVQRSNDAHAGHYALKGQIVEDSGASFGPFIHPATNNFGFRISQNYATVYGWYKSSLIGNDLGLVEIWAFDSLGSQVGFGTTLLTASSSYTLFTIPVIYVPTLNATEMSIIIQMTDTMGGLFNIGSYFLIDDLSYNTPTTGVTDLKNNFYTIGPNPASEEIRIKTNFRSNNKHSITIYDVSGKVVYRETLAQYDYLIYPIDVRRLPAGCYIMTVTDGENSTSEKIVISH